MYMIAVIINRDNDNNNFKNWILNVINPLSRGLSFVVENVRVSFRQFWFINLRNFKFIEAVCV